MVLGEHGAKVWLFLQNSIEKPLNPIVRPHSNHLTDVLYMFVKEAGKDDEMGHEQAVLAANIYLLQLQNLQALVSNSKKQSETHPNKVKHTKTNQGYPTITHHPPRLPL